MPGPIRTKEYWVIHKEALRWGVLLTFLAGFVWGLTGGVVSLLLLTR